MSVSGLPHGFLEHFFNASLPNVFYFKRYFVLTATYYHNENYSLVDITDEILQNLIKLVYQLLCQDELVLAKLLRKGVLSKYEHRESNSIESILSQNLTSMHISTRWDLAWQLKLVYIFHNYVTICYLTLKKLMYSPFTNTSPIWCSFHRMMSIHDFTSEAIAEQMTLLDLDLFQKIEVSIKHYLISYPIIHACVLFKHHALSWKLKYSRIRG